ncbi:hypothetical protein PG994_001292 [Apiospora phragmitis]|uniref:Rhodopsin domain-containing protein n=1 Tax=Apiospora phragmitis TaxID=2905665 RepID=A0ABR1WT38_9PEZI
MAIFTTLLALVSVILRDLVPLKTRRNPDRADGLANLAMVLALVELGLTMTASLNGLAELPAQPLQSQEQRKGSGKPEYPFPVHYAILSSHFYLLASMTAKAAACLMCLHLMAPRRKAENDDDNENNTDLSSSASSFSHKKIATSSWHRRGYWTILIATVAISLLTLGLTTTAMRSRIGAAAGDRVILVALRVHGAWSAASDLALALFPSLLLSRLAMLAKKRVALWGVMGLGVIVAACAVIKCIHGDSLYKTILWGTLEQNLGITALNLPTYSPLAASVCRGLTSTMTTTPTTTTTTAKTKTKTATASVSHRGGEDNIFLQSLSNMHGRHKGSSQRAQVTTSIQSSPHNGKGDGKNGSSKNINKKNKGESACMFWRGYGDKSLLPPRLEMAARQTTWRPEANGISFGVAESNKSGQEGNIPRGQWIENGIMKTVSVRVNSGENFDVELWELGGRES